MTAAEIALRLGGACRSGTWWRCRCPAHRSRGPTLALCDGDDGVIIRCWAGCDARDVLMSLRRLGLLGIGDHRVAAAMTIRTRGPISDDNDAYRRVAAARRTWNAADNPRGTPVMRYLAGRGITMALPPSLRWAPSLRRPDGTSAPAMVARIDSLDGELIGVSRTWLTSDPAAIWRRLDRAMLGRAAGGAVRLAPAAEMLMVSEGIETALSAMQATAMQAWAALSTSGLVALALPPIVRTVIILADNDRSGAGERAARVAAARWLAEGRTVRIALPPTPGTDFNDVLTGRAYAEVRDVAC